MMDKKVSVVMPCYNHEKYVGAAISSVLAQAHRGIELIVVDDRSTDSTAEIIRSFEKKDSRVVAIYNKKNEGCFTKPMNKGLARCSGDYVALTCSDDIWHPEKISRQLAALEAHPDCDVVHSDASIMGEGGKKTGKSIRRLYRLTPAEMAAHDISGIITRKNICCMSTILLRKGCLSTCPGFDPELRYAPDWWFYIELCKRHKFHYMPEALADYRMHSTNLTRNANLVYKDYFIIHSRLAARGVAPKEHLIAAAFAAAIIGEKGEMRKAAEAARKLGLSHGQRLKLATIERLSGNPSVLLSMNSARQFLLGAFHGFAGE
jgi:alpha-1,3-rhamnosyltransferase